jgi:hypothetical protein
MLELRLLNSLLDNYTTLSSKQGEKVVNSISDFTPAFLYKLCPSPRGLTVGAILKNTRPAFILFGLHQESGYNGV